MSLSLTERQPATGWRTMHLLLLSLLGFLLVLGTAAVLLLRYSALQPSVRQLAVPLTVIVELVDASDANPATQQTLTRHGIVRADQPPPTSTQAPIPYLSALTSHLRAQTQRRVQIERGDDHSTRLWISTARGDWIGVPLEPLRSLVAKFALWVALIAILLAALSAWWLARRLAAPLERLAQIAGRLPEPVDVTEFALEGPREVRLLGNRLAEALGRIDTQRRERDLMLAGLSHDLRTPLMRLLLRIDLIETIADEDRAALGADIHELDQRIDRFIEHARTGAEEPFVTVDLKALLEAEMANSATRGQRWQTQLEGRALLRGQAGVLRRLLANLVDNAEQHGIAPFSTTLQQDTQILRLTVANALPTQASEPHHVTPHRGFGLALCRHIAQAHGGHLVYGLRGPQFYVELQLPSARVEAPNDGSEPS